MAQTGEVRLLSFFSFPNTFFALLFSEVHQNVDLEEDDDDGIASPSPTSSIDASKYANEIMLFIFM